MDEELVDIPVNELLQEGLEPSSVPVVDTIPSGSNIIDATQNVIIDTAENVTQVFDSAKKIASHTSSSEPLYMEIEFWVGIAFIFTVLILLKPLMKIITDALHNRIKRVTSDIEEAIKLRDDAQVLLADYERKFADTETQQAKIENDTKKNLQNIKRNETARMEDMFKIKERDLRRNLQTQIEDVRTELSEKICDRSVKLAQKAVESYLQNTDKSRLIDDAIEELDKFIK